MTKISVDWRNACKIKKFGCRKLKTFEFPIPTQLEKQFEDLNTSN